MNKIRSQHGRADQKKKEKAEHHMPVPVPTGISRTNFLNPLTGRVQVFGFGFFF